MEFNVTFEDIFDVIFNLFGNQYAKRMFSKKHPNLLNWGCVSDRVIPELVFPLILNMLWKYGMIRSAKQKLWLGFEEH